MKTFGVRCRFLQQWQLLQRDYWLINLKSRVEVRISELSEIRIYSDHFGNRIPMPQIRIPEVPIFSVFSWFLCRLASGEENIFITKKYSKNNRKLMAEFLQTPWSLGSQISINLNTWWFPQALNKLKLSVSFQYFHFHRLQSPDRLIDQSESYAATDST